MAVTGETEADHNLRSKMEALLAMKAENTERVGTANSSLAPWRTALKKRQWGEAYRALSAAHKESALDAESLAEWAQVALLTGHEAEGGEILARAHQAFMEKNQCRPAARCAFWLGFMAMLNNEMAKASGWLARAARCLEEEPECAERGYLLLPTGYRAFHSGDLAAAEANFLEAGVVGKKFGENDLVTLALQGHGRALIRQGNIAGGVALLDEAMVAVTTGEVSPLNAGGVYCSVLDACGEIFDLRRAHEWTSALERWCASEPDVVPYRGHCKVRRAELLQVHGEWEQALSEAERASDSLSQPVARPAVGGAYYVIAEVHRLRGEFAEAERAYRSAGEWQNSAGPGLALLRLAQGQSKAAVATIERLLEEVREPGRKAKMLEAAVEIRLAGGDVTAARQACDELNEIVAKRDIIYLRALARHGTGAVLLAEGKAKEALPELRESWRLWCELEAPYEAARARVQMARVYEALEDDESARLELESARESFAKLGATYDLGALDKEVKRRAPGNDAPLTVREMEVLRLVAKGRSNRNIADTLHISEKTVARHLSNIFTKLDLNSRTAAAAYAYDRGLL
jgi:DNA-binding CsgD family transcriptional regulator